MGDRSDDRGGKFTLFTTPYSGARSADFKTFERNLAASAAGHLSLVVRVVAGCSLLVRRLCPCHARKSERALLGCESDICCVSRVESYSLLPLLFVQRAAKIPHACSRLVLWIPHGNVMCRAGGPRRFPGVSARPQGGVALV